MPAAPGAPPSPALHRPSSPSSIPPFPPVPPTPPQIPLQPQSPPATPRPLLRRAETPVAPSIHQIRPVSRAISAAIRTPPPPRWNLGGGFRLPHLRSPPRRQSGVFIRHFDCYDHKVKKGAVLAEKRGRSKNGVWVLLREGEEEVLFFYVVVGVEEEVKAVVGGFLFLFCVAKGRKKLGVVEGSAVHATVKKRGVGEGLICVDRGVSFGSVLGCCYLIAVLELEL